MGNTLTLWGISKYCRLFTCVGIMTLASAALAIAPGDGYFYGIDMEPIQSAQISTIEADPAVALIFAVDQKTADITRQFDQWFSANPPSGIQVYAIAVEPEGLSREVVLEAISQRNLQMPVFLSRSDMLLGDDFRLLVLNDDAEVHRFTTADFAGVDAALRNLGGEPIAPVATPAISTPEPQAPLTTTPDPVVTDTQVTDAVEPEVDVKVETGTLPDGSTYTRVTTTTKNASSTANDRIRGGEGGDSKYVNSRFGMIAEFPPDWQYQVAEQNDGAVAIAPSGSQMDLRVWALVAGSVQSPQQYVDETLESLASRLKTRVNVDRRFNVDDNGEPGLDITYNYSKPMDPDNPGRGGLLFRGRMQVFVDQGYVKAVSADAPSAEFRANADLIETFFRSFEIRPDETPLPPSYNSSSSI